MLSPIFKVWERKFQGTKVPGNESSRERKFLGHLLLRSESSMERKFLDFSLHGSECSRELQFHGNESCICGLFALWNESADERKLQIPIDHCWAVACRSTFRRWNRLYHLCFVRLPLSTNAAVPRHASVNLVYDTKRRRYAEFNCTHR